MHFGRSYFTSEFPSIQCAVSYKQSALTGLRVAKGGFHRSVGAESGSFCRLRTLLEVLLSEMLFMENDLQEVLPCSRSLMRQKLAE